MQRRDFAKTTIVGMAMAATLPLAGEAAAADPNENVLFTESDPGHWAKVVATHLPQTPSPTAS